MVTRVTLADGGQAILEDGTHLSEPGKALIRLENGRQVLVPQSALLQEGTEYRLPFTAEELTKDDTLIVPIIEETLRVTKRNVVTGGVRLTKRVTEHEETVDEPLLQENVQIERVPINQIVAEVPQPRQEGDTLIIPILEEVLVVEKRLMLKEEIRITRTQTQVHQPQVVTLRTEEAVIEEIAPEVPPTQ